MENEKFIVDDDFDHDFSSKDQAMIRLAIDKGYELHW